MPSLLGLDLGGTKIAATRFDDSTWEEQASERVDTPRCDVFDPVLEKMLALIDALRTEDTIAIGIGVPGLIRRPEGVIVKLPNIKGAKDVPLKDQVEKATKLNTVVGNDANCFALAEALHGAGKGHDIVVGITMGTGVGAGIVLSGSLFFGSHGFAAEVGHMLLKPGEPPFETEDKRGDVEQFLSGTAMGKRCETAKRPEDYLRGEVCAFLQTEVLREVAWMSVNLAHLIDPSVIVFGGSAGRALKPYLKEIETEMKQWILPGTPLPELKIAELKNAGMLGAALLTLPPSL